mgnify:CR=1 FL=1
MIGLKIRMLAAVAIYLTAQAGAESIDSIQARFSKKGKKGVYAVFFTTQGVFVAELYEDRVPETVKNFTGLAEGQKKFRDPKSGKEVRRPFYNGLIFHRVIKGFMIQTGCPLGAGTGGPGYRFEDEFHSSLRHNTKGILSMANSGRNTNGSQFFITVTPTPHLDNKHSVFGKVIEGYSVVDKISKVKTALRDRPQTPVVMQRVAIIRTK